MVTICLLCSDMLMILCQSVYMGVTHTRVTVKNIYEGRIEKNNEQIETQVENSNDISKTYTDGIVLAGYIHRTLLIMYLFPWQ